MTARHLKEHKGVDKVHSIEAAIEKAKSYESEAAFFIGGGEVYKQALPFCSTIYLTLVHTYIKGGDVYFPEVDVSQWVLIEEECHPADERHLFPYSFLAYRKPTV